MAISGLNFPLNSKAYLMHLVAEIAARDDIRFIIIAGNILAGKHLVSELKRELKYNRELPKDEREKESVIEDCFVTEAARQLHKFLPVVKNAKGEDVKYHIVAAEKIYDMPLGVRVLKKLCNLRNDVRLFTNPEAKIPVTMPGFGEIRVIVPRKTPWFYENITGLPQRLLNAFSTKTFSGKPPLVLAGCTGTGVYIPRYRGVPLIAVPTCHKIDEQLSTEGMVGATVITVTKKDNGKFLISPFTHDFRSVIANERELAMPKDLVGDEARVFGSLESSSASLKIVQMRVRSPRGKAWTLERVEKALKSLISKGYVEFDAEGNRYLIAESLVKAVLVSLDDFLNGQKTLNLVVDSCRHIGAIKTLYSTLRKVLPELNEKADAAVLNGDCTQGISHNFEYNGELVPTMNGPDKHELIAAYMQVDIMIDGLRKRWNNPEYAALPILERLKKCIILFIYGAGNHDEGRFNKSKDSIDLWQFDATLRSDLIARIFEFLESGKHERPSFKEVKNLVDERVVRVGESGVVQINGIPVALKHPHQGGTSNKGSRVQQTMLYFASAMGEWDREDLQEIPLILVANFHEAASLFMSLFGTTRFGVMTGAGVFETKFEKDINKFVFAGQAVVKLVLNKENKILGAGVVYHSDIDPEDEKIVKADKLTMKGVTKLCGRIVDMIGPGREIPWR